MQARPSSWTRSLLPTSTAAPVRFQYLEIPEQTSSALQQCVKQYHRLHSIARRATRAVKSRSIHAPQASSIPPIFLPLCSSAVWTDTSSGPLPLGAPTCIVAGPQWTCAGFGFCAADLVAPSERILSGGVAPPPAAASLYEALRVKSRENVSISHVFTCLLATCLLASNCLYKALRVSRLEYMSLTTS